jgi:Fic family protein
MTFPPKITIPYELKDIFSRINSKKHLLDSYRPLSPMILDKLRKDFTIEWTYNSNHIEGNTLNLMETKVILEQGITIGGKSLREHFEVINHKKAIEFVESLVDRQLEIRSVDILKLHELVLTNIMDDFAGRLRSGMVRITGANFTPPNARIVPELMDDLITYTNAQYDLINIIHLATIFHHRLVWIHPFVDGNGRTARLAMNLLLMRAGYPPVFILTKDRQKYYTALNAANNNDYQKLLLLMLQAAERSLDIYINSVSSEYDDYLSTQDIAMEPEIPYGQEYISLLARRGRIDAYKEGKLWLTTKKAVIDYMDNKRK